MTHDVYADVQVILANKMGRLLAVSGLVLWEILMKYLISR